MYPLPYHTQQSLGWNCVCDSSCRCQNGVVLRWFICCLSVVKVFVTRWTHVCRDNSVISVQNSHCHDDLLAWRRIQVQKAVLGSSSLQDSAMYRVSFLLHESESFLQYVLCYQVDLLTLRLWTHGATSLGPHVSLAEKSQIARPSNYATIKCWSHLVTLVDGLNVLLGWSTIRYLLSESLSNTRSTHLLSNTVLWNSLWVLYWQWP